MNEPLHLDDEALSAVLDGEATAEESAHADACAECSARLAALRDASLLVRGPVPDPDPDRREAAIAAALAGASARVVPLRRPRIPPAWLGAAAAVVIAVTAVALVQRGGDDGDDRANTALSQVAGDDDAGATSEEQMESFGTTAEAYDAGDIGAIEVDSLEPTIEGALASARLDVSTTAAAGNESSAGAAAADAAAPAVPCEPELRDSFDLGALVLRATGTFEDEAVVVLAFDLGADLWVFVVTPDACAIRVQQTFAR